MSVVISFKILNDPHVLLVLRLLWHAEIYVTSLPAHVFNLGLLTLGCLWVQRLYDSAYYFALVGERRIAISLSVCLSVCEHISGTAGPIFMKFCAQIPCNRGSVLLWRRCATMCTSGFMDDVTFGCSGPYGDSWLAALQYRGGV